MPLSGIAAASSKGAGPPIAARSPDRESSRRISVPAGEVGTACWHEHPPELVAAAGPQQAWRDAPWSISFNCGPQQLAVASCRPAEQQQSAPSAAAGHAHSPQTQPASNSLGRAANASAAASAVRRTSGLWLRRCMRTFALKGPSLDYTRARARRFRTFAKSVGLVRDARSILGQTRRLGRPRIALPRN